MKCENTRDRLTSYFLGDLDEASTAGVRKHLKTCHGCRAEAQKIEPTLDLLRDALAASSQAPKRLAAKRRTRLLTKVTAGQKVVRWITARHIGFVEVAAALFICIVLGGMYLPAVSAAREKARRTQSMANLSQMGKALIMYSIDHDEAFPESLEELKEYGVSEKMLKNPKTGQPYVYRGGGLSAGAASDQPVAIDRQEKGANVLRADGSVGWVNSKELKRDILPKLAGKQAVRPEADPFGPALGPAGGEDPSTTRLGYKAKPPRKWPWSSRGRERTAAAAVARDRDDEITVAGAMREYSDHPVEKEMPVTSPPPPASRPRPKPARAKSGKDVNGTYEAGKLARSVDSGGGFYKPSGSTADSRPDGGKLRHEGGRGGEDESGLSLRHRLRGPAAPAEKPTDSERQKIVLDGSQGPMAYILDVEPRRKPAKPVSQSRRASRMTEESNRRVPAWWADNTRKGKESDAKKSAEADKDGDGLMDWEEHIERGEKSRASIPLIGRLFKRGGDRESRRGRARASKTEGKPAPPATRAWTVAPEAVEMEFNELAHTPHDVMMEDVEITPPDDLAPAPAKFDSLSIVKSPVIMRGIYGGRVSVDRQNAAEADDIPVEISKPDLNGLAQQLMQQGEALSHETSVVPASEPLDDDRERIYCRTPSPKNEEKKKRVDKVTMEIALQKARTSLKNGDWDTSEMMARIARRYGHPDAPQFLGEILKHKQQSLDGERKESSEEAEEAAALELPSMVEGLAASGERGKDDKISITLDDVELKDVVRMFTRISGANILATDKDLEGRVTVNLQDADWDTALDSILDMHNLKRVEKTPGSGVYSIEKQQPEDKPHEQVFIEAKFMELDEDAVKDLGINWQALGGYSIGVGNQAWALSESRQRAGRGKGAASERDRRSNQDAINKRYYINGTAVLGADDLRVVLSALDQTDGVSVISNPKMIVGSEESAVIHIGQTERPFVASVTTVTGPITTYEPGDELNVGTKLTVTPTVSEDGNITVEIEPEQVVFLKGAVAPNGSSYPVVRKKRAKAIFSVESGKTIAIRLPPEEREREVASKIPVLGDIPLIGKWLFSHTRKEKTVQERIMLVTVGQAAPASAVDDPDRLRELKERIAERKKRREQAEAVAKAEPPKEDVRQRAFGLPPMVVDQMIEKGWIADDRAPRSKELKTIFQKLGVEWPAGSSIEHNLQTGKLTVVNTEKNLQVFGAVLAQIAEEAERERMDRERAKEELAEKKQMEDKARLRFVAEGVNPFYSTVARPFSTFSIDVDTAAYTLARNYMLKGYLPPAESVRTEEFVNFFDYTYKPPVRDTFRIATACAPSKFGRGLHVLKIGVKGRRLGREEQRQAILTFLVDTSGSMDRPDRLGLVKKSLRMLMAGLAPHDRVAIVQYGSRARLALEHTPASEREKILAIIDGMQCGGSTNLEDGMGLAYRVASRAFVGGAENRVLALSDGVANLGTGAAEDILAQIEIYRKQGIFCSVFGFGMGTYNDEMLEKLANKGDGAYAFIDSEDEARRVFVEDLSATLNTIAADVKIQVEFNPDVVKRYRQLGYENRQLKKEQFRDDTVDAGEVGSGQSVTALYEIELQPETGRKLEYFGGAAKKAATVRVRYRRVDTGAVEEIEQPVWRVEMLESFEEASTRFKLAACVAEFAEILRGNPFAAGSEYEDVAKALRPLALELILDKRVQELTRMVEGAAGMSRGE